MKIVVCDPCKAEDDTLTKTERYFSVKGQPQLRMDVCDKHHKEVGKLNIIEYVRYAYKSHGLDLSEKTDEEVKAFLK